VKAETWRLSATNNAFVEGTFFLTSERPSLLSREGRNDTQRVAHSGDWKQSCPLFSRLRVACSLNNRKGRSHAPLERLFFGRSLLAGGCGRNALILTLK
jgi:hypothetical protein